MPPPKPPGEQATPTNAARRASASKPSTPANRKPSANAGATPKSAPAGGAAAAAAAGPAKKKPVEPPSLLTDFLLGRPSPQRVRASQSQPRRKSVAALDAAGVREELRQEMRAAAVRKLQQPGGVKDRVKNWQKANATAMKTGVAMKPEVVDDAASEPTEILVQVDAESVTEEDRVRIKMRQKARRRSKTPAEKEGTEEEEGKKADAAGGKAKKPDVEIHQDPPSASKTARPLPKKRIVSDEHWMKQRQGRKSPPRKASPKAKVESSPAPLPKDFLARTAQNPTIHDKIKDWTQRVEIPDSPPPPKVKKYRTKGGDSITIEEEGSIGSGSTRRPSRASQPTDDGIRVTPVTSTPRKPKEENDDGIRIKPTRVKEVKEPPDDGIRVKPATKSLPDDGIRVRPGPEAEGDELKPRPTSPTRRSEERGFKISGRQRNILPDDITETTTEHREAEPDTPTKKRGTARRRPRRSASPTTVTQTTRTEESTDITSRVSKSADESDLGTSQVMSDLPSIAPGSKKLADIPVGYSAFSELDLPLGADARNSIRRPKAQRNSSLKAVPKVLKSLVSEGKKIISHDKVVDPPPRTGINKPPSIENWLNTTVDPFVDEALPKKASVEKEWVKETRRRSSSEAAPEPARRSRSTERREDQENADPAKTVDDDTTPKKSKTTSGSGLKRKGATRSTSSPLKPGQRKPFKEQLKDAFRGASGEHKFTPPVYASYEARPEPVGDSEYTESEITEPHRNSDDSTARSRSPDPASTVDSSSSIGPLPIRRKPPTNGFHELSTIVSEASHSTHESDTVSTVSQSTITQSTALTKSTDISRGPSHKSLGSGLKRRLTKHSDLVSVLSLPDNGHLQPPARARSIRAGGRLLRKTSKVLDNTPIEDLLQEFVDDEHYYQRELKTLVEGVVPVLLKQVVNGDGHSKDLFGSPSPLAERAMSKAVVEMGISLEKLKNFHRHVPMSDVQLVLAWLESVQPIYDRYLDVWRLGFQDLVVNLAPAPGKLAEEDSLVNALPRNDDGDALDENGEPVDVAHLLKRPLVRIKWMTKLIKGAHKIQPTPELGELLSKYEQLQDKARRRHREETARKTDEDANNTDVTRTRDLRSLAAMDGVMIDQCRQVNAKDAFSLDLTHSNGQRLECKVEVIFRDNVNNKADKGDVLIRESGIGGRSWLLFPPIPKDKISARKGDSDRELIVMVRGYHNYRDWFELLTLSCDDEDQVADWVDILGSDPMPPTLRAHLDSRARLASASSPKPGDADVPVGERKLRKQPSESPAVKSETPSRYHKRSPSVPTTPSTPTEAQYSASSPDRTPTQHAFSKTPRDDRLTLPSAERGSPLREGMRPDPAKLTKTPPSPAPYREDGAPPPPAHRTLKKTPPVLTPPVDNNLSRVKRRGSSPLKHEYHPSDISSESSVTNSDESDLSDSDSSSDELDESDVPDVLPAISIKEKIPTPADSVISDSSLTPSASASQAGVAGGKESTTGWSVKAIAAISYWSERHGIWKDVDRESCSIVVTPGLIEAFPLSHARQSRDLSDAALGNRDGGAPRPLVAQDLTPVVMIRMSNSVDLEIRSPVRSYSILHKIETPLFRFRSPSVREGALLYEAVHTARMNNAKFLALQEEARINSFGLHPSHPHTPDQSTSASSKRRRTWFGRKNSYRASARAPTAPSESQNSGSHDSSGAMSASSFLKRLTTGRGYDHSFNIDKSTVDNRPSRPASVSGGTASGPGSLYTSSSSGGGTLFRAPSLSISSSRHNKTLSPGDRMPVRLYSAQPNKKWEDFGNCVLQILRPPPGMHQELKVYHGMEKRVKITSPAKKEGEEDLIVLDVVLGSGCFSRLGTKGVVVKVWEDIRDMEGRVGRAPAMGGVSGKMKTWCLQTKTNAEADWVVSLLMTEVELG